MSVMKCNIFSVYLPVSVHLNSGSLHRETTFGSQLSTHGHLGTLAFLPVLNNAAAARSSHMGLPCDTADLFWTFPNETISLKRMSVLQQLYS